MTTVPMNDPENSCDMQHHAVWHRVFSASQREQQVEQDMTAGYRIPAVLTAIMVFGLLSMMLSVWLAI